MFSVSAVEKGKVWACLFRRQRAGDTWLQRPRKHIYLKCHLDLSDPDPRPHSPSPSCSTMALLGTCCHLSDSVFLFTVLVSRGQGHLSVFISVAQRPEHSM